MFFALVLAWWGIADVYSQSVSDLLDVSNPKFFIPGDQIGIEFGFVVDLFTNNSTRRLLIGAPSANTSQRGVTEAGALYECDLNELQKVNFCSQVQVDTRDATDKYSSFINEDAKDHQRLGASLVARNNHVVVCAPNWHYYEIRTNSPIDTPVGTCFESWNLETFQQFSVPYDLYGDQSIDYLRTGSCQSGFSVALTSKNEKVLGSPGCYNWQGDVFAGDINTWWQFGKNYTQKDIGGKEDEKIWVSNIYSGFSVSAGIFSGMSGFVSGSPRSTHTQYPIKRPDDEPKLIVSPMVNIYLKEEKWLNLWNVLTPPADINNYVKPEWLFSYFGYSLAVADVDNNGLDDVIVGAPYYHNRSLYDQGAILVYLQQRIISIESGSNFQMVPETLVNLRVGKSNHARFGSCISAIGDIDGDAIQDIAVGAPYSEDGGKVYIYLGSSVGLQTSTNYVLSATDSYMEGKVVRGFGTSIAPSFMVRKGTQNDLAIGAANSDIAVIFESKVLFNVDWSIKFEEPMDLSSKCAFSQEIQPCTQIKTCLLYKFSDFGKAGDTRPKEFLLTYNLDKDYQRLFFKNGKTTKSKIIFIEYETTICFPETVYTNKQIPNFDAYRVEIFLNHSRNQIDDKSALHHSQVVEQTQFLEITIDCNSNDVSKCQSDLTLQSNVSPSSAILIDDVKFTVTFELIKRSQPSYSTALKIETDDFLDLSGKPSLDPSSTLQTLVDCRKHKKGRFICYLGNFLNEHDLLKFNLSFTSSEEFLTLENLREHSKTIVVKAVLTSLSQIMDPSAAKTEDNITLSSKPDLQLTKDSFTEFVTLDGSSSFLYPDESDSDTQIGPESLHSFKVYNPKNYAIENVTINIYLPDKILDDKPLISKKYMTSIPENQLGVHNCKSKTHKGPVLEAMRALPMVQDISWLMTQCQVSSLAAKQSLLFKMNFRIVMKTLKEDLATMEFDKLGSFVVMESNLEILQDDIIIVHNNHIITEIHYKKVAFGMPAWWLILIALVVALMLLIIIVAILCKCNFFKRKKTAELIQEPLNDFDHDEQDSYEPELQPLEFHQIDEDYDNISSNAFHHQQK